jgi:two-component system sensor histidine kinase/response regulator
MVVFMNDTIITPCILIVDNQPENLLSMEAVLSDSLAYLVTARSGKEALMAVLEYDFALILMDVQMPEMDGFETAEIIRQRQQSQHTPIIFVTAINKDAQHLFRGYSLGAVDYVFKPYLPEILKSKVAVFIAMYLKTAELRRRKEHLEHTNQDLELFSHAVQYDLRSLLERVSATLGPLDDINHSNDFIGQWIASLTEFSGMSNQKFAPEIFSMELVCREAIAELKHRSAITAVDFQVAALPQLFGDAAAIRIVCHHLILDALRFVKKSAAPKLMIGCYTDETGATVIYIKNDQIDIETRETMTLIDLLRSLGTESVYDGLGISLAVAQGLIRRHGGKIWGHATPNLGAVFCFMVPQVTDGLPVVKGRHHGN